MNDSSTNDHHHSAHGGVSQGYERSDTTGRSIFIGLAISVVLTVAITFVLNEFFVITREQVVQAQVASQVDPKLAQNRAVAARNLNTYEWVDSSNGIVRIPIDRAMDLMVQDAYRSRTQASSGETE